LAKSYANERKQFGRLIRSFQAMQFDFAKKATLIQAARGLLYQAARARDLNQPILQLAAMAKYFAGEVAEQVSSWAIEVFGGYGYTKEFLVEKFYRDAKIGSIYEGTTNMQLHTIAKTLWEKES
jgi:butyryl-CoA dehydrogenase/short/branched chain acyl-CoA dehydrogenase